jgi:hypothetical protein
MLLSYTQNEPFSKRPKNETALAVGAASRAAFYSDLSRQADGSD